MDTNFKLPEFVIIGAQRCGTSSLYYNLMHHPDLNLPHGELHFFDKFWDLGVEKYKRHFPDDGKICGEKTPSLIFLPHVHQRMMMAIPEAKFILVLREPVARAFSGWKLNHARGNAMNYTFEQAIAYELLSKMDALDHLNINSTRDETQFAMHMSAVRRGFYIDQIEHFLKYFEREQLHIVIFERMIANTQDELDKIFDFLGVNSIKYFKFEYRSMVNVGYALQENVRQMLRNYYKPYNERLFEFLGTEIPEWND